MRCAGQKKESPVFLVTGLPTGTVLNVDVYSANSSFNAASLSDQNFFRWSASALDGSLVCCTPTIDFSPFAWKYNSTLVPSGILKRIDLCGVARLTAIFSGNHFALSFAVFQASKSSATGTA